MIYLICPYFNETVLLRLRLAEELSYIDKAVFVEATTTYNRKPKPLNFPEDLRSHPKIDWVVVDEKAYTASPDNWERERLSRVWPERIYKFADDDVIINCDLDEVNRAEDMPAIIEATRQHGFVGMKMHWHMYFINVYKGPLYSPFACTGKFLRESGVDLSRLRYKAARRPMPELRQVPGPVVIDTHGRHFDYLAMPERIALYIQSFSHLEYNRPEFTDITHIKKRIEGLVDLFERTDGHGQVQRFPVVPIDETYPRTILDNMEEWRRFIYPPPSDETPARPN